MAWAGSRLAGPLLPSSSGTTMYTPTTGVSAWIKEILIGNNSTNGGTMKVGIGGVNSSQLIVPEVYLVAKSTSAAVNNFTILAMATFLSSTADAIICQNGATSGLLTVAISGEVGP